MFESFKLVIPTLYQSYSYGAVSHFCCCLHDNVCLCKLFKGQGQGLEAAFRDQCWWCPHSWVS